MAPSAADIAPGSDQFRRIVARNVGVPLITGLVSTILFVLIVVYLVSTLRWVEHTERVITRASEVARLVADQQAAVRGYVITGDDRFLEPFDVATPRVAAEFENLRALVADSPQQLERLRSMESIHASWLKFAQDTVALRRSGGQAAERVVSGQGRRLTDAFRAEFDEFVAHERRLLVERNQHANFNGIALTAAYVAAKLLIFGFLAYFGRRELLALSRQYAAALDKQKQHTEHLNAQAWLREGQNQLGQALAGREDLQSSGRGGLEFLATYLGAAVAAMYVAETGGTLRRVAAYGFTPANEDAAQEFASAQSLVSEVARSARPMQLAPVPQDYIRVTSGLGHGAPASVLIAPLLHEGRVSGVVELGLMRPLQPRDAEFLERAGPLLASSVESARYRQRLQDMLEQTQQLNEELQVQQEELRTANEELEEQSRALRESQAQLESQQAELEQTNLQLSEYSERVAEHRNQLAEAQGQLQARAEELQRASRYKSEFLANMSHELRTPLNSSLILSKLLADNPQGNLSDEQVRFAQSIHSAGNDLLALINDVLDIAKVEAGKLEVRPETTSVTALAQSLRSTFEPLAQRRKLALEVEVDAQVPQTMVTDRQRVEQILKNLLSNAVKFTEQGSVTLRVMAREGGLVAFEVRDTGVGIDISQQAVIFEAFRQADGTASRKYGGTGLGLSISRDLARLLGGRITVNSYPGQGSTFTLELPVQFQGRPRVDQPAPTAAPLATPAPAARLAAAAIPTLDFDDDRGAQDAGERRVLVAEDDVAFARILFDLAHELGYRCAVATHAREACELVTTFRPHAVLLDVRLPDDSGLSVLQKLKEDPATRHIPVHLLSAEDHSEMALQMGAVGYALKPKTREELRTVFQRLEDKLSRKVKRVLVVEDDARQRESVAALIGDDDVEITAVERGQEALAALAGSVFDCMVMDLKLPDMTGQELLRRMASGEGQSFPPVIVYTGRNLTRDEEAELLRYSRSIIIKGARSPERLLDEVTLFLHKVESELSGERQKMLRTARNRERAFEGRRILVVDDDVRNIFALASALEMKGAQVDVARNGREALEKLATEDAVDLVLMDVMMPEMDGYAATREIRRNPRWQKLPVIAVTAKAMKDDQQKCLEAGANDYLAKPLDLERLFSLMRVWLPKMERAA